ncbi:MAG: DUF4065 domain-containing protein [Cryomorphaceae bacterium]|nr:DUF4065 domain-containing protein [Cryomorphaceae bacterium]
MSEFYTKFSPDQVAKIGNSIIYFSERIDKLSKTKLLKLLYILEEISIQRSGIPVLNLKFKTWKFGPVSEDIFIELSSEATFLKGYLKKISEGEHMYILPAADFTDDEFSQNDIDLMDEVISKFGNKTAKELISYTHRQGAPWYISATKNGVLGYLNNEEINNTEFVVDMEELIQDDERKLLLYKDFKTRH